MVNVSLTMAEATAILAVLYSTRIIDISEDMVVDVRKGMGVIKAEVAQNQARLNEVGKVSCPECKAYDFPVYDNTCAMCGTDLSKEP